MLNKPLHASNYLVTLKHTIRGEKIAEVVSTRTFVRTVCARSENEASVKVALSVNPKNHGGVMFAHVVRLDEPVIPDRIGLDPGVRECVAPISIAEAIRELYHWEAQQCLKF